MGGPTIQEVGGEMMMGLSIYGVAVMMGSYTPDSIGLSTLDTLSRSDPDKSTSIASTLHAHCAKPDPIQIDLNPLP